MMRCSIPARCRWMCWRERLRSGLRSGKKLTSGLSRRQRCLRGLGGPVILSGRTTSRSEVVLESKDPYPLKSTGTRQGILSLLALTNSPASCPPAAGHRRDSVALDVHIALPAHHCFAPEYLFGL